MMKRWSLLVLGLFLWGTAQASVQAAVSSQKNNDDVAIIIGNKSYLDQDIPEVTFAHNDARAMKLFVQNVLNIREENIIYLEDATQAQMESAFGRAGNHRGKAFQYVKPDVSNLYVFYSGHGVPGLRDKKSYLLPVDADIETTEINGFPLDVLYENLTRVEAKSVSIFLDACFSGNSHGGPLIQNASGAQIVRAAPSDQFQSGLSVLTAVTQDQLASWDEESRHGLFTEYLMRALYGQADYDSDGEIDLQEIETYLKRDMRYKARRTYNRDQIPTLNGNREKVMVAALNGRFPTRPVLGLSASDDKEFSGDLIGVDAEYYVLKNANVRRLPDVRSERVDRLSQGDFVFVADKVKNAPWYLVELEEGDYGFVYETLLSEFEPEQEDNLANLKERLARLEEEQARRKEEKIIPAPPQTLSKSEKDKNVFGPEPNWSFDVLSSDEEITSQLKSMGALLAKQSFIETTPDGRGKTMMKYNWIRVDVAACSLKASVSFYHDKKLSLRGGHRSIHFHDRQIAYSFKERLGPRKARILKVKDTDNRVLMETEIFRVLPFTFKSRQDRRLFVEQAKEVRQMCRHAPLNPSPVRFEKGAGGTDFKPIVKRRPPPPGLHRPPPPRR